MCQNNKKLPAGSASVKSVGEDLVGPWLHRNLLVVVVTALVRMLGSRLFGRGLKMDVTGGANRLIEAPSKLHRTYIEATPGRKTRGRMTEAGVWQPGGGRWAAGTTSTKGGFGHGQD